MPAPATPRTFVIGRSRHADIVLADPSVAARHAELVIAPGDAFFLTCCGNPAGTWRRSDRGGWERLRQAFLAPQDQLRFGQQACRLRDLLAALLPDEDLGSDEKGSTGIDRGWGRWQPTAPAPSPTGTGTPTLKAERRTGPVERDPVTGEIVRRQIVT